MALTKELLAQLKDFFPVDAHEFLNGKTYIREDDITNRLDDVDPDWTFKRLGEFKYRDNQVIATFRLTVCGVSRDGVGMDSIKQGGAGEAEKSAATDALKRASRLFGIGRYILDMKGVTDHKSAAAWLANRRGVNASTGEIAYVQKNAPQTQNSALSSDLPQAAGDYQPRPPVQALKGNGAPPAGQKKESSGEWSVIRNDLLAARKERAPDVSYQEWGATVNKLHEEGALMGIPFGDALAKVVARVEGHRTEKTS